MIAAGTGVTPMYQFIKTILNEDDNKTKISLVYANHTNVDIILKPQLDELARRHPDQFNVHYLISDIVKQDNGNGNGTQKVHSIQELKKEYNYDSENNPNINLSLGRVNTEIINNSLPRPDENRSILLVCGKFSCRVFFLFLKNIYVYHFKRFKIYTFTCMHIFMRVCVCVCVCVCEYICVCVNIYVCV